MPRKPKAEKKTVTVVVNGTPVTVTLHPPSGARTSWYAYWPGLVASRSTGQADFNEAVKVVEDMLRNGSRRAELRHALLSDEEFEQLQRAHFGRKTDPAPRRRAEKSLEEVLDAINALKEITGPSPVSAPTPDDSAAFQRNALTLPKNRQAKHPTSNKPANKNHAQHNSE